MIQPSVQTPNHAAPPFPLSDFVPSVVTRDWPFLSLRHEVSPPVERRLPPGEALTVIHHLAATGPIRRERHGVTDEWFARQGECVFVNAGEELAWGMAERHELLVIRFAPEFLRTVYRESIGGKADDSIEVMDGFGTIDPVIDRIGRTLLLEMDQTDSGIYMESLATVLAVHLLRHYSVATPRNHGYKGGLPPFKFRRVIDYIAENLSEDLSLAALADLVGLSPWHFCREFKRTAKLAPHQYLVQKRLETARRLLAETNLPIVEVSFQAGFQSQSHFTTVFRHHVGCTPKTYRGRHR